MEIVSKAHSIFSTYTKSSQWSRLVHGASPAAKSSANQQRLIRFKKVHDQLQLIWRRNNSNVQGLTPPEPVLHAIQSIRQILQNEVQTPTPHLCARHVSTFHIYSTIAQLAAIYPDENIIQETLDIFAVLLDSEEGDFVKDKSFADALIGFISTISSAVLPVDLEAKTVEVLFGVATKLRPQPELLPTWFRPNKKTRALPAEDKGAKADKEEFPLFYLTLGYMHHDGRAGEFARTGLLYLIESAVHFTELEQWIIESDLATLMASGLGALYSQLSRKLVLAMDEDTLPPAILLSETSRPKTPHDAEKTTSPDFKAHLITFLKFLIFWQDVLEHCSSSDVKQSLLDHFKLLFLQQLLYPSLIESSDRDGGSSVAVLTYLRCIIESIDHPDLVQLTFEYLLAIPEPRNKEKTTSRPQTLARRRRSQSLIASLAQEQEKPLPDIFNLDDLVLASLRSNNQQTVTATLRLIPTRLHMHHRYENSLLNPGQPNISISVRSMQVHERNAGLLFSIIEDLMDNPGLAEAYEIHLQDAQNLLESHPCSMHILGISHKGGSTVTKSTAKTPSSAPVPDDPVLNSLVRLLHNFLANEVETNLSLTNTFSTIASCARRRLDGWLINYYDDEAETDDGRQSTLSDRDDTLTLDNPIQNAHSATPKSGASQSEQGRLHFKSTTSVCAALDSLVQQVETFRREIEDFDRHLSERRQVLKAQESTQPSEQRNSEDDSATSIRPPNPKDHPRIGSITERLSSPVSTAPGTRSHSPRGRQAEATGPPPSMVRRLSHLRQSPSRSPSKSMTVAAGRAISPSPLRNDTGADTIAPEPVESAPAHTLSTVDRLQQKVKIRLHQPPSSIAKDGEDARSETSSMRSDSDSAMSGRTGGGERDAWKEVSLSHVLTNIVVLQEFVLELVAIMQVRASLFGEVRLG